MSIKSPIPLPPIEEPYIDIKTGRLAKRWFDYERSVDEALRKMVAMTQPVTVAKLPATATPGDFAFASNGRKTGEGAGAGTGVFVFFDGTAWRVASAGAATVTA